MLKVCTPLSDTPIYHINFFIYPMTSSRYSQLSNAIVALDIYAYPNPHYIDIQIAFGDKSPSIPVHGENPKLQIGGCPAVIKCGTWKSNQRWLNHVKSPPHSHEKKKHIDWNSWLNPRQSQLTFQLTAELPEGKAINVPWIFEYTVGW